jgi:hypothetical protein
MSPSEYKRCSTDERARFLSELDNRELIAFADECVGRGVDANGWVAIATSLTCRVPVDPTPDTVLAASAAHWELPDAEA